MSGGTWTEYAVVEAGWTPEGDGPPLWGWGTLEGAQMQLRALPVGPPDGWHIVERDVTVSAHRPWGVRSP